MDISGIMARVKVNLVVEHGDDDVLLAGLVAAAVDYARAYQKVALDTEVSPATVQAVVMLASHWYESRDGSTGGFFADNTHAAGAVWVAVNRLLALGKQWEV